MTAAGAGDEEQGGRQPRSNAPGPRTATQPPQDGGLRRLILDQRDDRRAVQRKRLRIGAEHARINAGSGPVGWIRLAHQFESDRHVVTTATFFLHRFDQVRRHLLTDRTISESRRLLIGAYFTQEYALEYGVDTIEVHADAIKPGDRVLLIDDLIATGGTANAAIELIRKSGGEVVAAAFVIDLPDLGGSKRLKNKGVKVHTLVEFEGD